MSQQMNAATRTDRQWLLRAIELSRGSSPVGTAYSVGAIIVAAAGDHLTEGYSRDTDAHTHAEESAVAKVERLAPHPDLTGATLYSSMEPCTSRKSRPRTCTELILAAGIRRVVYALREPPLLAECHGTEVLRSSGIDVIEIGDLADQVRAINSHVLTGAGDGNQPE
ncbi:deaminase [Salinispora arenicola]|uniref:deaminase n=1 Tax=Salinispora arenicola TaxID=168697 RepID=UPI000370AEE7|nr:deaminase [Salinispora arenicola]